jgi:DnaK suppressor protein
MEAASSDEAELSPTQLEELRAHLERLRSDLQIRLEREQSVALEAEAQTEPMDAAEQTREQDDAVLFTERDRTLLREIEHALAKFETGSYGKSESSGRPIEYRRLAAIPWARVAADEAEGAGRRAPSQRG